MAETADARPLANGKTRIDFQTEPARYRHWQLKIVADFINRLFRDHHEGEKQADSGVAAI